jgi:hypothetical protein
LGAAGPSPNRNGLGLIERTIGKSDQPIIQWQFSNATLGFWAWLLATIIDQLKLTKRVRQTGTERREEDETMAIGSIQAWCHILYAYVHWKEPVVQTLLTKMSLNHSFNLGHGKKFNTVGV